MDKKTSETDEIRSFKVAPNNPFANLSRVVDVLIHQKLCHSNNIQKLYSGHLKIVYSIKSLFDKLSWERQRRNVDIREQLQKINKYPNL